MQLNTLYKFVAVAAIVGMLPTPAHACGFMSNSLSSASTVFSSATSHVGSLFRKTGPVNTTSVSTVSVVLTIPAPFPAVAHAPIIQRQIDDVCVMRLKDSELSFKHWPNCYDVLNLSPPPAVFFDEFEDAELNAVAQLNMSEYQILKPKKEAHFDATRREVFERAIQRSFYAQYAVWSIDKVSAECRPAAGIVFGRYEACRNEMLKEETLEKELAFGVTGHSVRIASVEDEQSKAKLNTIVSSLTEQMETDVAVV